MYYVLHVVHVHMYNKHTHLHSELPCFLIIILSVHVRLNTCVHGAGTCVKVPLALMLAMEPPSYMDVGPVRCCRGMYCVVKANECLLCQNSRPKYHQIYDSYIVGE